MTFSSARETNAERLFLPSRNPPFQDGLSERRLRPPESSNKRFLMNRLGGHCILKVTLLHLTLLWTWIKEVKSMTGVARNSGKHCGCAQHRLDARTAIRSRTR